MVTSQGRETVLDKHRARLPLALDVGELGGNLSVAYGEHVHAAQMPRLSFAQFAIDPADYGAIAAHNHIFGFEGRIRIARKPVSPELNDGLSAFDPQTVRWWRGVFKNSIIGQQTCQRVRVMSVESFVE